MTTDDGSMACIVLVPGLSPFKSYSTVCAENHNRLAQIVIRGRLRKGSQSGHFLILHAQLTPKEPQNMQGCRSSSPWRLYLL